MVDTIVKCCSNKFTIPERVEKASVRKKNWGQEEVEKQVENTSRNVEVKNV